MIETMARFVRLRWRSLLFVPADNPRLVEKAHQRGADALIVDLEDAVPAEGKMAAREGLCGLVQGLAGHGVDVLVRVNREETALSEDLDAAIQAAVWAIVLPKVENAASLHVVDEKIKALEARRGLPVGEIGLIALIESPGALFRLPEISAGPRVIGLALGTEDFALALGVSPTPACLTLPCQMLALAAAAADLMALGMPTSIANFSALDAYREAAETARAMGLTGALCIHPAQISVINKAFAPSPTDVAWAQAILAAWRSAEAGGTGTAALDGQMIDKPVMGRARAILASTAGDRSP